MNAEVQGLANIGGSDRGLHLYSVRQCLVLNPDQVSRLNQEQSECSKSHGRVEARSNVAMIKQFERLKWHRLILAVLLLHFW